MQSSTRVTKCVTERLDIKAGEALIVIRRLRTVNDLPFCVETTHLPAAFVSNHKANYGIQASAHCPDRKPMSELVYCHQLGRWFVD